MFYNIELNTKESLDTFYEIKDKINNNENINTPVYIHNQTKVSNMEIKQIIPIQSYLNIYPSSYLLKMGDNNIIQCSNLSLLYRENLTDDLTKLTGLKSKLNVLYLENTIKCFKNTGSDIKNLSPN